MSQEPHDWAEEPLGTTAEELARLVEALGDWARESRAGASATAGTMAGTLTALAGQAAEAAGRFSESLHESLDEHVDTGAPECTYCPLCRTVHVIRESSPEVKVHLASAASSLMHAAAAVLNAASGAAAPGGEAGADGSGHSAAGKDAGAERTDEVERIDLDGWDE